MQPEYLPLLTLPSTNEDSSVIGNKDLLTWKQDGNNLVCWIFTRTSNQVYTACLKFYGKLYMVTHVSEVLIVSRSRTFCNKGFEIIDSFLLSIVSARNRFQCAMTSYRCAYTTARIFSLVVRLKKLRKYPSTTQLWTKKRGGKGEVMDCVKIVLHSPSGGGYCSF